MAGAGVEHWPTMQSWPNGLSALAEADAAVASAAAAMVAPRRSFVTVVFPSTILHALDPELI